MLNESQKNFFTAMRAAARAVLPPSEDLSTADFMSAIACLESGYGEHAIGVYNVIGYHWIEGQAWSSEWVDAKETVSGKPRRYRKFDSYEDCMAALCYLISKSSNYKQVREKYRHAVELAKADYIQEFGQVYSPIAPSWGGDVARIMGAMRR